MAKLRLGIIGAGSWAVASHLPNFAKRKDDVEFVGVSRKGPDLLAKIKDDWGFQVASEDYRDVIDAGMDICLVASPHGLHYEHAKAAPDTVPEQATWTDPRNGGGYGQAQLTHALGVALWLTGLRGEAAFALMKAVLDAPVEHHDAVVIRYDNGSIGTMAGGSNHLEAGDNRHQLE